MDIIYTGIHLNFHRISLKLSANFFFEGRNEWEENDVKHITEEYFF